MSSIVTWKDNSRNCLVLARRLAQTSRDRLRRLASLGPMQLVADTGDTVADKRTEVNVDEAVETSDGCD